MKWALILLAAVSLIELLLWVGPFWRVRKIIASGALLVQSVAAGAIFGFSINLYSFLFLVASIYRVINLLRLIEGRTEPKYLYKVSRQTSLKLILAQIILAALWIGTNHIQVKQNVYMGVAGFMEMAIALMLVVSLKRNLKTTLPVQLKEHYASRDLPSISVLIPARNETVDLEQCLTSLVASNYPKLEILVLDDCSQNKHTPEIIKSFAQAGVRFIAGDTPPESWLAKNFAYSQLSEQASGEIFVFAGVDTRFSPDSLTYLVETLLEKKKVMASVMPINKLTGHFSLNNFLFQPSRYAWELALPRKLFNRPPVLSTCWLIATEKFNKYGGFKAVSRSNSPESYFARRAVNDHDGYSFIRASKVVGLTSEKQFNEQRSTAIRTRYPQAHRRLEIVGLYSLLEILTFFLPVFGVIWGVININWLVFATGVVSIAWLSVAYTLICYVTYSKFIIRSLFIWPIAALCDIAVLNYSMWQYEFNEVLWKGRNICLPVMQLPSSDQE